MIKKIAGIILFSFSVLFVGFSQKNNPQLKQKIEARRIGIITNGLKLTPMEAEKFWPFYHEFQKEKTTINKAYKAKTNFNLLTDEEVEIYIEKSIEKEERLLVLKKEYINKLKEVLPIRKVALLPRVERKFKEWMLQRIKERKKNN